MRDKRDTVEYAMAFMHPEILKKVVKDREARELNDQNTADPIFNQQVESMFGQTMIKAKQGGIIEVKEEQLDGDTIRMVSE